MGGRSNAPYDSNLAKTQVCYEVDTLNLASYLWNTSVAGKILLNTRFLHQCHGSHFMNISISRRSIIVWIISMSAVAFVLLALKEGGTVLFGDEAARAAAGNDMPFVLWFNFLTGFA